jgi:protein ImuB
MLWFAIHLPLLPLESFCATLPPEQAARPVALLRDHVVAQVNTAAADRGLRPGIKRATALALAADLLLADSHASREAAALQGVVHAALAFTPAVTVHDAQTVLLEVQPSLRLFGGADALHQKLCAAVQPLGHRISTAAAPTARGAALLAQWRPPRTDLLKGPHTTQLPALQSLLLQAPVWLLGPGRAHWDALQGMGLHTLADLHALPRSGLARRFGEALLEELDQALGLQPDPRRWVELPERFDARMELFARVDRTELILHGAQVLLARLVAWAQARQGRVAAFTLRMLHERARDVPEPFTDLRVELAEPSLDPAHLQMLLRERLDRLALLAPTMDLLLHCRHLVAAPAPNGELFPTRASEAEGLTRLLERLRARLGEEQVQRVVAVADHRPERASRSLPVDAPAPEGACEPPVLPSTLQPALPLLRPTWLLADPLPLAAVEWQPLMHGRPLDLLSGPERIETGWWDDAPVARDYYIAQDGSGALVWIYRHRLPVAADQPVWFLQGLFA